MYFRLKKEREKREAILCILVQYESIDVTHDKIVLYEHF